jgi:predicted ATPase
LRGFLSYAPDAEPVELRSLNVLIGPNGSGKSNFLDAFDVLRAAPGEITLPIQRGGGIDAWVWQTELGVPSGSLSIEAIVRIDRPMPVRYRVALAATGTLPSGWVMDERVEDAKPRAKGQGKKPYVYFGYENGRPMIHGKGEKERRALRPDQIDPQRSILAQRREPDIYPELSRLAERFGAIRAYRSWSFGSSAPGRRAEPTDLPTRALSSSGDNLVLVLNRLCGIPRVKREMLERLRQLYAPLDDLHVEIAGGTAQLFLHEGDRMLPATRLSDGTLRYLSLLAILCDPDPPPLILIEEPELGLHPDVLPTIADLLVQAAERTQLIVTTHSGVLVDAFTESPEHVLVCERDERFEGGTRVRRLDGDRLAVWLKEYSLGTLWSRGDIGGNTTGTSSRKMPFQELSISRGS